MSSNFKNDYYDEDYVIDLTGSCDLAIPLHLMNTVIELDTTDDSFNISNSTINFDTIVGETKTFIEGVKCKKRNKSIGAKKKSKKSGNDSIAAGPSERNRKSISGGLGECPICCDNLGKNPLASTKCGHVYCLKCLETSLKVAKKCPTCRCVLKGASAYHPLYLN